MEPSLSTSRYLFNLTRIDAGSDLSRAQGNFLGRLSLSGNELTSLVLHARAANFKQVGGFLGLSRTLADRTSSSVVAKLAPMIGADKCAKNNVAEALERACVNDVTFPAIDGVYSSAQLDAWAAKITQIFKVSRINRLGNTTRLMVVRAFLSGQTTPQIAQTFNDPTAVSALLGASAVDQLRASGQLGAMTKARVLSYLQGFCATEGLDRREEYFHRIGARMRLTPSYRATLVAIVQPGQPAPSSESPAFVDFPRLPSLQLATA